MSERSSPMDGVGAFVDQLTRRVGDGATFPGGPLDHVGWSGTDGRIDVDIAEHSEEYVVTADVPGCTSENLDVLLAGDHLLLSAAGERGEANDDGEYVVMERRHSVASRSVRLPGPVEEAGIAAVVEDGVLTVTLPKAGPAIREDHDPE